MHKTIKTVTPLVKKVLQEHTQARNSDIFLILKVWQAEGCNISKELGEKIMAASSPESIRRTRQKFQENNEYLADDQIRKGREENRKQMEASLPRIRPHLCTKCRNVMILSADTLCDMCV